MSIRHIVHKSLIKCLCIIGCFAFFIHGAKAQTTGLNIDELESFNVTVKIKEVGTYIFPAFYQDPDGLFLPADAMLNLFKVVNKVTEDGKVIKGFFETEANSFEINTIQGFIRFKDNTVPVTSKDYLIDMGSLFIKTEVYKKAFGFNISFNFRALTSEFETETELPVVKLIKQEKLRERLGGKQEDEALFDTIIKRDYHLLKGTMLDWSVASMQAKDYNSETRMELGLGMELLGGEVNLNLNWSNVYGMNKRQQIYNWRWADNSSPLLRQIQLGRVSSKSIATLLSPIDGFYLTNAPTTVRKALGTYTISDYTEPDWVIELYINNVLMDFAKSDASGFYTFTIPLVYGSSRITLRFYGPAGEMRSDEKSISMPFNMLPKGELEYKVTGGMLMDSLNTLYGRAEVDFGISRWFTAGIGAEYVTSLEDSPVIPFVGFTLQPFSKLLIIGEYAHKVRWKGTMNLTLPWRAQLDVNYARYTPGQKAIIYNYLEERSGGLSFPFKVFSISGYNKFSLRQNLYSNYTYNSGEYVLSTNYKGMNLNYSNYLNWTPEGNKNMYGNLSMGFKIGQYISFRPSAQYNYTTSALISVKGEVESRINQLSNISFRYERNMLSNNNSFNLSFRYDLPFASTSVSSGYSNKQLQASESLRGSFAFGAGRNKVLADKRGSVGRSGFAIESYVDTNFNGKKDKGEKSAGILKVRCSGGSVEPGLKDSIVRVTGLEPFVDYTLIFDESGFDNLTWKMPFKNIKVTSDPNQFKKILIPVYPMAEISGMVTDESGKGIGRALVVFKDAKGAKVNQVITESDGYFTVIGFKPGKYEVGIDSAQLRILKKLSDPVNVVVKPDIDGDIVDVGNIVWRDIEKPAEEVKPVEEIKPVEVVKPVEIAKPVEVVKPVRVIEATQVNAAKVQKLVPLSLEIAVVHYNDGNYSLQLGAFLTEYQAEILVKKIGLRLDDVSLHIDIENKYYKVRTPIVSTRGEAVKLARRIQSLGLLK